MTQPLAWDLVQELLEHQRAVHYDTNDQFNHVNAGKVNWATVRRLYQGKLDKVVPLRTPGFKNKKVPDIERALKLENLTIQFLATREYDALRKLPNTGDVQRYLETIIPTAPKNRRRPA